MNMNRAAAAANRDTHGDHVLQGGHAVLKEDTDAADQDVRFSDVPETGAMKQSSGLEGEKPGNFQTGAGTGQGFGDSTRQRNTQSHVGQV
ncbi:hypothetical protein ACHAQJ_003191 [Trichoderma viride]